MSDKIALVAGATGLVGKELVKLMLSEDYYERIIVLSRREMDTQDDRLEEVIVEDFDKLEDYREYFNAHHIYCCLGTTMKQAGSKENFKKIDLDYPLKMAELAKGQPNFEAYHVVTSVGAKPDSALFYNRVKGELEKDLKEMGLPSLQIYQPSLLLGKRKEFRLGEEIGKALSAFLSFFVIGGSKARLWSIHSQDVAVAMLEIARRNEPGTATFSPREMIRLAHKKP